MFLLFWFPTEKLIEPVFTVNLTDQEVTENDAVEFQCTVEGKPLPRIKW